MGKKLANEMALQRETNKKWPLINIFKYSLIFMQEPFTANSAFFEGLFPTSRNFRPSRRMHLGKWFAYGFIHKPCGQIFRKFRLPSPFVDHFIKKAYVSSILIWTYVIPLPLPCQHGL